MRRTGTSNAGAAIERCVEVFKRCLALLVCMAKIALVAGHDKPRCEPFKEWIKIWGSHKAESFPTAVAMRPF